MINAIQPTVAVRDASFDDLKSENKKERFELFAEQFKSESSSDKSSKNPVNTDKDKDASSQPQSRETETAKIKADFSELGEKLKEIMQDTNNYLEFKFDKDTNRMILRLIDSETKEVVQQFPPELALKIARIISQLEGTGHIANAKV